MRVQLPGIHTIRTKLRSGQRKTYHYAWRGGPRLPGEPGSPEFLAAYQQAYQQRKQPNPDTLHSLIVDYKTSSAWRKLRDRTTADYLQQLAKIEVEFGSMPLAALDDPRVTREFLKWRDSMDHSPRQADYAWTVLMRVISWGRGAGVTSYRPPDGIEKLYKADRSEIIWESIDIDRFKAAAPDYLNLALSLGLYTGQREGDLVHLPWSAYDGSWIRLRQSKGGRRVEIPVHHALKASLDAEKRVSPLILTHSRGRPWKNGETFGKAFNHVCPTAGIEKARFTDLRGTAVTRLAEAECTVPEIASITGHSMKSVEQILERYLKRTSKLASAAIMKLQRGEE